MNHLYRVGVKQLRKDVATGPGGWEYTMKGRLVRIHRHEVYNMVSITKKGPYKALDLHDNEKKYVQAGGDCTHKIINSPDILTYFFNRAAGGRHTRQPKPPANEYSATHGPRPRIPKRHEATISDRRAWFRAGRLGVGPICSTSWRRSLYEWGCKRTRRHRQSVSGPEPASSLAPDGSETLGDGYASRDEDRRRQR